MITGLDHIAIAVPELARAIKRFTEDFGLPFEGTENVPAVQTSTAFFNVASTHIELVHPLDGGGPIAKYLEKRGGGLHHLCFRSNDIESDMTRLRAKGYRFLTEQPTSGAHGCRVVFIHPESCDGVLIELNQPPEHGAEEQRAPRV